jgi:hypothetical protein
MCGWAARFSGQGQKLEGKTVLVNHQGATEAFRSWLPKVKNGVRTIIEKNAWISQNSFLWRMLEALIIVAVRLPRAWFRNAKASIEQPVLITVQPISIIC